MNLLRAVSKDSVFAASNLLLPVVSRSKDLPRICPLKVPDFIPPRNFYRFRWSELLGMALTHYPQHLSNASATLFRQVPVCPRRFAVHALAASLVLHLLGYAILPDFFSRYASSSSEAALLSDQEKIVYYRFVKPEPRGRIPRILAPGPGSMPGSGSDPGRAPAKGATQALGTLFAVSHPRLPDNSHQTILQDNSPPELRIKKDLKLPNMILAYPLVPRAPLHFDVSNVHPLHPEKRQYSDNAPPPSISDTRKPLAGLLVSSVSNPHLAVPIGAAPAPLLPSQHGEMSGDTAAPQIESSGANGNVLLILGTDPADSAASVALPQANRYGEFSIALGGDGHGSPGGREGGLSSGAGTGGDGVGGNRSMGMGRGTYGGGGRNSGSEGIISLKGSDGGNGRLSDPRPDPVASMVYPLPSLIGVRHNALVVSAGPMGGGGLDIYGALPCGKIYSVFLTASGKRWSLEYCQKSESPHRSEDLTQSHIVHTELPLVPPEAEEEFDFKRVPLPPEKANKMIILRGEIGEDGKPQNLEVFRGLSPEMDAAAQLAFSRWTFRPAMRSGKPVKVQILLGIPAEGGTTPPGS
jgi:TonB-like protein